MTVNPVNLIELEALQLNKATEAAVTGYWRRNNAKMSVWAENAYPCGTPELPIFRHTPLGRLAILVWMLPALHEKFRARGIPDEIYLSSLDDIKLRAEESQRKTGRIGLGLRPCRWFRHLAWFEIFKLGSLQFQRSKWPPLFNPSGEGSGSEPKLSQTLGIKAGDPVINIHIQNGANLAPRKVGESFLLARQFFPSYFPELAPKAFVCSSWVLYPGIQKLLGKESRLRQFAERFTIVFSAPDPKESIRRIYGKSYRAKADFPRKTSLQKAALGHFDELGEAVGIIPF